METPPGNKSGFTNRAGDGHPNIPDEQAAPPSGQMGQFNVLFLLMVLCTVFYYFGEVVDFFRWESLRWGFLFGVHDVHRLFFLAPIVYAGYFFGTRAAIIITIIVFNIFLPRALLISPFPDPLLRMVLFILIAGTVGYLTGRESQRRGHLKVLLQNERDTLLRVLENMKEGAGIVDPDYRIRFINAAMRKKFGEGTGSHCYAYLHRLDGPCPQVCLLPQVRGGSTEKREDTFSDGRRYEVEVSPYTDRDGTVCQLTILRDITESENTTTKKVRE